MVPRRCSSENLRSVRLVTVYKYVPTALTVIKIHWNRTIIKIDMLV